MRKSRTTSTGRFTDGHFARVNKAAIVNAPVVFKRLFPDWKRLSREFRKKNRDLRKLKFNRLNYIWHDYPNDSKGEDAISLAGYLLECSKNDAAYFIDQTIEAAKSTGV